MTNPTTPLPVQEPAGAVEASKLAERLKAICDSHINSATAHEAAYRLIESLALPPVTQAKSEAAWWTFKSITGGQVFYEGPARPEGAPERAEPLYAAPQEAVERQPLTDEQIRTALDEAKVPELQDVSDEYDFEVWRAAERHFGIGPATQERTNG